MRCWATSSILSLLPLLSSCCPTVWLQVNKDNPAPWPAVEVVGVADSPYAIAPLMPNRFDVLEGGARTIAAADFTDTFDPKDDVVNARARAWDDLTWIVSRYPKAGIVNPKAADVLNCDVPAKLLCTHGNKSGLDANCHGLEFERPITADTVWVKGRWGTIKNTECTAGCTAADLSFVVPGTANEEVRVCVEMKRDLSKPLLSFVHLSDIHVRDPSISLTDRELSHKLDRFAPLSSFEYDEDQEFYNQYLVEALFATINGMVGPQPTVGAPQFVIHTGDSTDTSAVSEAERLHVLMDRLRIPFFQLLGNHDVFVFGNLTPTITHDDDKSCTPVSTLLGGRSWFTQVVAPGKLCVDQNVRCPSCVGSESALLARPTQEASRSGFIHQFEHARYERVAQLTDATGATVGDYCADTSPRVRNGAYSRIHGFDLGTRDDKLDGAALGYYAFVTPLADGDRNAVIVALNSEDLADGEGGTRGRVAPAQLSWLERVLSCVHDKHPRDLVLVFAHHPLGAIDVDKKPDGSTERVADVLDRFSGNVVGYFYGHSHDHSVCGDGRSGVCSKYWEVETASLIEFPQEGRLVRIKQINSKLGFIELSAIRERLTDQGTELARYVSLARQGAERDICYTRRESIRCSPDQRPYRTDGRDANARLFFSLP
jgi:hypothetical protein